MPKFSEFFTGKKGKNKKLTTQTPEQEQLLKLINDGLASGEGPFKEIFGSFDPAAFEAGVSKPAIQQFQDEILPMLQEKFIAGNQAGGSGMQRAGAKAATDLQSKLAQLMYEAQNQQKQNKISGVNTALGTKAFENIYKPGTEGALSGFVKGAGQGLGNAAGSGIANGAADLGNWVKGIIAG
jgi:hypothetical protein